MIVAGDEPKLATQVPLLDHGAVGLPTLPQGYANAVGQAYREAGWPGDGKRPIRKCRFAPTLKACNKCRHEPVAAGECASAG